MGFKELGFYIVGWIPGYFVGMLDNFTMKIIISLVSVIGFGLLLFSGDKN